MENESIYDRLAKAQAEMKNPVSDAKGHATASREYGYSTLANVLDIVRPACNKQGLFVSQRVEGPKGELRVVTSVYCAGEKFDIDEFPLEYVDNSQRFGSAVTYAKRYSLISVFGIASKDEDDDGAANSQRSEQEPKKKDPTKKAPSKSQKKVSDAMKKAKDAGMSLVPLKEWATSYFDCDIPSLSDNQCEQFADYIDDQISEHMAPVEQALSDTDIPF